MPLTTLKEKGQFTLPNTIRKQINATKGDLFDCEVIDGKVVMTQQRLVPATPTRQKRDLSQWIGAKPGVFKTTQEVDEFIRNQRNAWG